MHTCAKLCLLNALKIGVHPVARLDHQKTWAVFHLLRLLGWECQKMSAIYTCGGTVQAAAQSLGLQTPVSSTPTLATFRVNSSSLDMPRHSWGMPSRNTELARLWGCHGSAPTLSKSMGQQPSPLVPRTLHKLQVSQLHIHKLVTAHQSFGHGKKGSNINIAVFGLTKSLCLNRVPLYI